MQSSVPIISDTDATAFQELAIALALTTHVQLCGMAVLFICFH